MTTVKYEDFFNIDPEYFPAVNLAVINNNPDVWKKYYPHDTFVKMVKTLVHILSSKQKMCMWVEGAYGTGKSHAVLTLKKLIDADESDVCEYFDKYESLDQDLLNQLQGVKNDGKILTVHRYGSSNIRGDGDLTLIVQESIEKALKQAGINNQAGESLKSAVIRYLSNDENARSFDIYASGSYRDKFEGDTAKDVVEKLKTYGGEALQSLMRKLFDFGKNHSIFTIDTNELSLWIKEVISKNNLKAIVFFWDEFSEFFINNKHNLTGFQELCEISETDPFYFVVVTHVNPISTTNDESFRKLNGRFVSPHSQISLPENIAFQLIGAALMKVDDTEKIEEWASISSDLSDRSKESRKLIRGHGNINDSEMRGILPIHPYAALILKQVSTAFDSNQRSMFDFIKNDNGEEIKGFKWFIENNGPYDDEPFLTLDYLWEFFYEKNRSRLSSDIRSILDYYSRTSNKMLDKDQKRVLKSILLLQAISQHTNEDVELFIPNERTIERAFEGTELEHGVISIAERMVEDKILFKKSLGNGKYQYSAYNIQIDDEEINRFKDQVDGKSTASLIMEELADKTNITDAIILSGALRLRYRIHHVSLSDFDSKIRDVKVKSISFENCIQAVVTYAKNEEEFESIRKKIHSATLNNDEKIIFIETLTPFGIDEYSLYKDEMAQSMYQRGKDNALATAAANNAKEYLRKWKSRILDGQFQVYSHDKPEGDRATSFDVLKEILSEINHNRFTLSLESEYTVTEVMYLSNALKTGVECGSREILSKAYDSHNDLTKLDRALSGAWRVPNYWYSQPTLLISKLKISVDNFINDNFNENGRVSIRGIFDLLKCEPYGLMPCNLSAFILGFLLKEYTNSKYSCTDSITSSPMSIEKLKDIIDEIIHLEITPNPRYKEKYLVSLTDEEKKFNESVASIFEVPIAYCSTIEKTREQIRKKFKEYSFPIWVLKFNLDAFELKNGHDILCKIIDDFCGVVNDSNICNGKSDVDYAKSIGRSLIDYPDLDNDLKLLFSRDNCKSSMVEYLKTYSDGELVSIAQKVSDGGQFINVLGQKFDADAANWVWNQETAHKQIDKTILEYKIIEASNHIFPGNTSILGVEQEWISKCNNIRISYPAMKNNLGVLQRFVEILYGLKKSGVLLESQRIEFLDQLLDHGPEFEVFYKNQAPIFHDVCKFALEDLSEDEIYEVLKRPALNSSFIQDRPEYLNNVDAVVAEYKAGQKTNQLKVLWKDLTNSDSPREWSKQYRMPIMCMVDESEYQRAKSALTTVSARNPNEADIDAAIEFLSNAKFISSLSDANKRDLAFNVRILKDYSVILTDIQSVKEYLIKHISIEPYDWYDSPAVDEKIRLYAEYEYKRNGCNRAHEKIDTMSAEQLREYLKRMIDENIRIGIEIIKNN